MRSVIIHKDNANKIFDSNALSMTISVQLTTVDSHSVAGAPRSTRHTLGSYYLVRGQVSPLVDAALKVV